MDSSLAMAEEAREEPLNVSKPLILAGGFQVFADQLYNRFIQLLAIAVGATVDQLGVLNAVKSVASNVLQIFFGRMADRFGKRRFIAAGRFLNCVILAAVIFIEAPEWLIPLISFGGTVEALQIMRQQNVKKPARVKAKKKGGKK